MSADNRVSTEEYLKDFYKPKPLIRWHSEVEAVVLAPHDEREVLQLAYGLTPIVRILGEAYPANGADYEAYPLLVEPTFKITARGHQVVHSLRQGLVSYDERGFVGNYRALYDGRLRLASLLKDYHDQPIPARFDGSDEFVPTTADQILQNFGLHGRYFFTYLTNFFVIGKKAVAYASPSTVDNSEFSQLLRPELQLKLKQTQNESSLSRTWSYSHPTFLALLQALLISSATERAALFESVVAAVKLDDIQVSLGGRIVNNVQIGSGKYPATLSRYLPDFVIRLIATGFAKGDVESRSIIPTDAAYNLKGILPAVCDDPDMFVQWMDFSQSPPAAKQVQSASFDQWIMQFFHALKEAVDKLPEAPEVDR